MERYTTGTGQKLLVHEKAECTGPHCVIHNPSDHSMKEWPTNWRDDRNLMERVCPHGVGHPDPDDIEFKRSMWGEATAFSESVHGCDGCCQSTSARGEPAADGDGHEEQSVSTGEDAIEDDASAKRGS